MAWTVESLAAAIRGRRISAVEATDDYLARIARRGGSLRAFVTVDADRARRTAAARDAELAAGGPRGPLHGVPIAYHDACALPGLPASCGTRIDNYFTSDRPCTAAARLAAAGAVTLGTLNMSELGIGVFGDNAHRGDVDNPRAPGRCAGGAGSGAAVAAGLVPAALAIDSGGSIGLPAAWCGVVGLKPTHGRISRAGVMPLSWSTDHVGPMAASVRDAALILDVIAGKDPADPTSSTRPVPRSLASVELGVTGLRIGVPDNAYFDGMAPEVHCAVEAVGRLLGEHGARVDRLRVPDPRSMLDVERLLTVVEGAAVHASMVRDRPQELQPVVRAHLEAGGRIPAHDYIQAGRLRARLTRLFVREVFDAVDLLLLPTVPAPAPARDEVTAGTVAAVASRAAWFSRLTRPFRGLGLPALAIPCGLTATGLPLSAQLVGRPFDEPTVLRAGRTWERASGSLPRP